MPNSDDTQTASDLPCSIQPSDMMQRLEELSNVGQGNVYVDGGSVALSAGGTYTIHWRTGLHGLNGPSNVSIDAESLGYTIRMSQSPTAGQNETAFEEIAPG